MEKKFCKYCGEEIDVDSVICPKCGRQIKLLEPQNKIENRIEETQNVKKEINPIKKILLIIIDIIRYMAAIIFLKMAFEEFGPRGKAIVGILLIMFSISLCPILYNKILSKRIPQDSFLSVATLQYLIPFILFFVAMFATELS